MNRGVVRFARVKPKPTESRLAPSDLEETLDTVVVSEDKPARKPRARRKPVSTPVVGEEGVEDAGQ